MKLKFFFLLFIIGCNFKILGQITKEDTLSYNIRSLVNELENVKLVKIKLAKYIKKTYFPNKHFMELGIDLLYNVDECSCAFLKNEFGSKYLFEFCEYRDSSLAEKHYLEIKNVMINRTSREILCFKGYNIFRYKNIICMSQYYTDVYSKLIKQITGDYPLFTMRLNKYESEKDRKYFNFERY
jgi:hypothetical protein